MTRDTFKLLFDKYFDSVRSFLYYRGADREQASDLAQDVFMRVWEKNIDIEIESAKGLLFKIAGDMFISQVRREKLARNFKEGIVVEQYDFSPEDQYKNKELFIVYTDALATMNENQRIVFMMSRFEGLKYSEIADRLQISVKAVEKRMSTALDYLRRALEV